MNHLLRAIGFPIQTQIEAKALEEVASQFGTWHKLKQGYYIHWGPDQGVEYWGRADLRRQLLGAHPHFLGTGRVWMSVERVILGNSPLEGLVVGRLNPETDDGARPEIVVSVPDFGVTGHLLDSENLVVTLQVAAFAEKLACLPNEADFLRRAGQDAEVESIRTLGEVSEPRARITGRIESVETRNNSMSGDPFLVLSVRVLDNWFDMVAEPKLVRGKPTVGGIVVGDFFLSGQAIPEICRKRFGLPPVDRPGHNHPDIAVMSQNQVVGLDEIPEEQHAVKAISVFFSLSIQPSVFSSWAARLMAIDPRTGQDSKKGF